MSRLDLVEPDPVGHDQLSLFGHEQLRFRYRSLRLAPLMAEEYLEKDNALSAPLAALMKRRREAGALKADIMQRISVGGHDAAVQFLLLNLVETTMVLTPEQEESFMDRLSGSNYQEARRMVGTWADRMCDEGREAGREAGLIEGRRQTLLRLLSRKFGPVPAATTARVQAFDSLDELDALLDRLLSAGSLREMGLDGDGDGDGAKGASS